jgi:NADH-ubiquinone oxidoreductase chain 2
MIFISILTLIVAKALPLLNKQISSIHFTRIASIIFIYTGAITLNCLYIQSIGSGIGIYSGLFHITQISQLIEIFLFIIGGLILIGWPQVLPKTINKNSDLISPIFPPLPLRIDSEPLPLGQQASLSQEEALNPNFVGVALQTNKSGGQQMQSEQNSLESYRLVSSIDSYSTDYSIIVLFSILGSSLLISSFDLISLYLSIELQSFGCAPYEAGVIRGVNLHSIHSVIMAVLF